ncbi:cellulose synthase [Salmonella enterica subsp. enterica]|uniref:Cellulose synthase n=1 Tax=Salmonella enterica I TaxID=59201 RepID=A0A3S4FDF5_SALET|nr:cellulose synthase [Salmonella enterica subsp. enterica]
MSQGTQVAEFSSGYLLDLIARFINWQMIGAIFVLLVAWLFLSQWIRVHGVCGRHHGMAECPDINRPVFTLWPAGQPTDTVTTTGGNAAATVATAGDKPVIGDMPAQTAPPTTANLNAWLNTFYAAEEKRKTTFPAQLPPDAQPFDLLVINICSLSWSDVEAAGLMSHPLWSHFDILFKHFNSGTSYSGRRPFVCCAPAVVNHRIPDFINQPITNVICFDNLAKLGFTQHLMMDHNGEFGGFLKEVRENGGMQSELDEPVRPANRPCCHSTARRYMTIWRS